MRLTRAMRSRLGWRAVKRWWEDRRLARVSVPESLWQEVIAGWPVAQRYQGADGLLLRETALRLLLRKSLVAGGDLEITDLMRLRVAVMASVPVLGLGLEWYRRWDTLVLYESAFIPGHDDVDENGIVHTERAPLAGEAWSDGRVILSWEDVRNCSPDPVHSVVLHEMAHQLDMLHDGANSAPPLHAGMEPRRWHDLFSEAWADLEYRDRRHMPLPVDRYGLEDPAEFFAVLTETFFEAPARLAAAWPGVYEQLMLFYRQDPRTGNVQSGN